MTDNTKRICLDCNTIFEGRYRCTKCSSSLYAEFMDDSTIMFLFLDIDGVINSIRTRARGVHLDNKLLANLNRVFEKYPNLNAVISSTWRLNHKTGVLVEFLKRAGLKKGVNFCGKTPNIGMRGEEVDQWLKIFGNKIDGKNLNVQYIIIDDDSDFYSYQKNRHINIDDKKGFTRLDAFLTKRKVEELLRP